MRRKWFGLAAIIFSMVFIMSSVAIETSVWARAGGGFSSGSRGSRSFSSPVAPSRPSSPSSPSPGYSTPGYAAPGYGTGFGRSPFFQGLAGGIAGGFLGNMLFGGRSYGAGMGGFGGSGIGIFDILIIGTLIYFGMRYFRRRRLEQGSYYEDRTESLPPYGTPYYGSSQPPVQVDEVERGLDEIRRFDPGFNVDSFKETAEDLFFRIQAGWMNRSLEGIENVFTPEMADYFRGEFARLKQQGKINRLENIAVRKVEPSEVWQEAGKDYITVFFTANLLDYTVDDQSGKILDGDKLNPVKFQEFWTFCRDIGGGRQWQLTAINQIGEPSPH
jgi:predicted lipid-binding transport protein (Tim44 family)